MLIPTILPGAKVPGFLLLDFETRSELELKEVGVWRYAEHPSTEWLCCGVNAPGDGSFVVQKNEASEIVVQLAEGYPILAYNAEFEYALLKRFFPQCNVSADRVFDLSAWCAAQGLPGSLDDVGEALQLSHRKDPAGHRLMLQMCKPLPEKTQLKTGKKWKDDPESLAALANYCLKDIETELELANRVPPLSKEEQEMFTLHLEINERGLQLDEELLEGAQVALDYALKQRVALLKEKLPSVNPNSRDQVLAFCKARGIVTGFTKDDITKTLERTDLPEDVRLLLSIRQGSGKTSLNKYAAMSQRLCRDGRIRGNYRFHGAVRTGRWAGQGAQFHNVSRGSLKPKEVEDRIATIKDWQPHKLPNLTQDLESCLRGTVIARPGHDLVCDDYAAIEARKVQWLAGDENALDVFRRFDRGEGPDPYCVMAASIFGVPVEKITKEQRQLGKVCILGAAYGMSGERRLNKATGVWENSKFQQTCEKFGMKVDAELASHAIKTFRSVHSLLTEYWESSNSAAIAACMSPGATYPAGRCLYKHDGTNLKCRLPSGRVIVYADAYIEDRQVTYMSDGMDEGRHIGWHRTRTYGGKLVENCCQAASACILRNALKICAQRGWPVVMHTHDEICIEVPEGTVSAFDLEQATTTLPSWAEGLPLAAKGWVGKRYRKD